MHAFELPYGDFFRVDRLRLRLDDGPHVYETLNAAAIEENWARETALNPALFDGRTVLFKNLAIRDGALKGTCHAARYASFLHWRTHRSRDFVDHVFANPIPMTSDGAVIAVEMGAHTANAGKVYFAAGSFEPGDFPGGHGDVDFNMRREMEEETGIDISGLEAEDGYHAVALPVGTVILKRYQLGMTAAEAEERIARHIAAEDEPELARAVIIRPGEALPASASAWLPTLVSWHFSNPPGGV